MLRKGGKKEMRIDRVKFRMELIRRGITQKQLAEWSGVTRATINSVACGKSCRDDIGGKIAKALDVDVTDIMED